MAQLRGAEKRGELLKQVQHQLDLMPRTAEPKVGAGVPLAELRNLYASLSSSGDQQLASATSRAPSSPSSRRSRSAGRITSSSPAERRPHPPPRPLSSAPSVENSLGNGAAVAIADTLSRLAEVHSRSGQTLVAEAHLLAAIDVLLGDVPADDIAHAEYIYSGKGPSRRRRSHHRRSSQSSSRSRSSQRMIPQLQRRRRRCPTTLERRQSLPPMPIDDNGDDEEEDEVDALAEDLDAVSLELHLPPQTPTTTTEMAQARQERLKSLRESVRSLQRH